MSTFLVARCVIDSDDIAQAVLGYFLETFPAYSQGRCGRSLVARAVPAGVMRTVKEQSHLLNGIRHSPQSIVRKLTAAIYVVGCFDRGHFATTTVEIPPRGRKSPFTSTHTACAHFTASSSTWFTMFSWKIPRLR